MKTFNSLNSEKTASVMSTVSGCFTLAVGLTLFGGFLRATVAHPVAFLVIAAISAVSVTLALGGE